MKGPARLFASFDENWLGLVLDYPGRAWQPAETRPVDWNALLEKDGDSTALDDAMKAVSSGIIRTLADRVETGEKNGRGRLRLFFEH